MDKILVINPGSTSTKVAVFADEEMIFESTISHSLAELAKFPTIYDQHGFRKTAILDALAAHQVNLGEMAAVVGRGGTVRPLESGTYRINEAFKADCRLGFLGQHASNLGAILADELASEWGIPAYIVDPPVVDELSEIARVTGLPDMHRKSRFHALNQKASARMAAAEIGKSYQEARIIVAHLGSGISVGAHENGRVVDVNDCLDSEGPLMPERSGSLPVGDVVKMCFSGLVSQEEMARKLTGGGGMVAHLGTNDLREAVRRIAAGDEYARLIYQAMAYQTAKWIAANAAVLAGKVDAIVITGGVAHDRDMVKMISGRVAWIAPVIVYPGENEMAALALGVLKVLRGQETAKNYDEETILPLR